MSELTGKAILDSIAISLATDISVNDIKVIYINKAVQSMQTPCAFLHLLNVDHTPEMRNRAQRDYMVDIRVHPPANSTEVQTWLFNLAEKICQSIESIELSGPTRSRSVKWNITDDVLHVIATYQFKVYHSIPDTSVLMQQLNYIERVN